MTELLAIATDCQVTMHFTLRLSNDEIVDTTVGGQAATFVVGDGNLPASFERFIIGMVSGHSESFVIPAKAAFGVHNPKNVRSFPKSDFSQVETFENGLMVEFNGPNGYRITGVVVRVFEQTVKVDFNHPLAGKQIEFSVEILSVEWPETPVKVV